MAELAKRDQVVKTCLNCDQKPLKRNVLCAVCESALQAVRQLAAAKRKLIYDTGVKLFGESVACGDGGCIFGTSGGMHTNGGCRCIDVRNPTGTTMTAHRLLRIMGALAEQVCEGAK